MCCKFMTLLQFPTKVKLLKQKVQKIYIYTKDMDPMTYLMANA